MTHTFLVVLIQSQLRLRDEDYICAVTQRPRVFNSLKVSPLHFILILSLAHLNPCLPRFSKLSSTALELLVDFRCHVNSIDITNNRPGVVYSLEATILNGSVVGFSAHGELRRALVGLICWRDLSTYIQAKRLN